MEDIIRYIIIAIGITYSFYKIRNIIFNKNYGCSTCGSRNSCKKKECSTDYVRLSNVDVEKIKKIKLIYKN